MKKTHLSIFLAATFSLFGLSGCGTSDSDNTNEGISVINTTKDAANAYTSIRISPASGVFSPLTAIELSGKEISKDLYKILHEGTTTTICSKGYVEYFPTGDSVATLNYHNCAVRNNKVFNGKATVSPLSGANVTVKYEGYSIHYLNSYTLLNTTVSYNNWDTIEYPSTSLNILINGNAFSAYKDSSEDNSTILPGYTYDYTNMSVSMLLTNDSISQYSATGSVVLASDCPAGRFQITTLQTLKVYDDSTLSDGDIKINNAEYEFTMSDNNDSNISGPSVILTIYGNTQVLPQSDLTPSCAN